MLAMLTGCALTGAAATGTVPLAMVPPPAYENEGDLAGLQDHSRHRLYDPARGPRCAVSVTPTGPRTWQLKSCEGELKCWALGGGGYDCEKPPSPAPQL